MEVHKAQLNWWEIRKLKRIAGLPAASIDADPLLGIFQQPADPRVTDRNLRGYDESREDYVLEATDAEIAACGKEFEGLKKLILD